MKSGAVNKSKTISSITRKITGKTVTISAVSKSTKAKSQDLAARDDNQQIATATPPSPPATIEIHLQLFQHKQHKMDPQSHKITETLPISSDMSATDVIDSMVKKHGYSLYHSECSDNSGPANQSFYLKKCIDSDTSMYRRVLDGRDSIMECLIKHQQGAESGKNGQLFFELCKHEENKWETSKQPTILETPLKGQTQLQEQQNDSDLCFFSPPHVNEVTDRKYRRRNSLPSYIDSIEYRAATSITTVSEIRRGNVVTDSPSPRTNKLKSLSEIMSNVVKEAEGNSHSLPIKNRRCSSDTPSPAQIRHLVSSPFVSPEKLYPKFVYTPMVTTTCDEGSSDQSPGPAVCDITPPVYSLDTSIGGSIGTSDSQSPSPPLQIDHLDESVNDETFETKFQKKTENMQQQSLPIFDDSLETGTPKRLSSTGNNDSINQPKPKTPSKWSTTNNTNNSTLSEMTSSPVVSKDAAVNRSSDADNISQSSSESNTSSLSEPRPTTTTYDISTGLVSPSRRQLLLQQATTHVLRRRSSAAGTAVTSPRRPMSTAVSDSDLNRVAYLQLDKHKMSRQTSTPGLISPARHDMLVRRASQRVRDASAKRKSLLIVGNDKDAAVQEGEANTESKQQVL